jgi:hypothetical protein
MRARSLRRFNWLAVYLPLLLTAIALVVLVGLLLWSAVFGGWLGTVEVQDGRALASGLADTIFLLAALPCALLCPVLPLGFMFGLVAARRKDVAPIRRLQSLLYKLESILLHGDQRLNQLVPRVTEFVIARRTLLTRLDATLRRLLGRRSAHSDEEP